MKENLNLFSLVFVFIFLLGTWPCYAANLIIEVVERKEKNKELEACEKFVRVVYNENVLLLNHNNNLIEWMPYVDFLTFLSFFQISNEDYHSLAV